MKEIYTLKIADIANFLKEKFNETWDKFFYDAQEEFTEKESAVLANNKNLFDYLTGAKSAESCIDNGSLIGRVVLINTVNASLYSIAVNSFEKFIIIPMLKNGWYATTEKGREHILNTINPKIIKNTDEENQALLQDFSKEWTNFLIENYPELKNSIVGYHKDKIKKLMDRRETLADAVSSIDEQIKAEYSIIDDIESPQLSML